MKVVVVLVAVLLLVWLLLGSSRRRARDAQRDAAKAPRPPAERAATPIEGMVTCAHCGVHLPSSLALQARGLTYCSAAHRDAGPTTS